MPAECRRLLSLRTAGGKTSVAKFAKFIQTTSADGRLRAGYQYHGARTGRWAGRGAQLHNLTKGVSQEDQEWIIHTVKKGGLPLMELFWTDPIHKLSTVIRGALVAAPGMKLVVADYSAIEARGVAWLSGQDDLLELYREGVDLYCWMAGHVFECDPDEVLERYHAGDPFRRFVGKQLVLGCGYQMGASRFRSYCAGMGVAISEALAERGVAIYRERTPMIRAHWKGVEAAATGAPVLQAAGSGRHRRRSEPGETVQIPEDEVEEGGPLSPRPAPVRPDPLLLSPFREEGDSEDPGEEAPGRDDPGGPYIRSMEAPLSRDERSSMGKDRHVRRIPHGERMPGHHPGPDGGRHGSPGAHGPGRGDA